MRELIDAMEDNYSKWRTREGIKNLPEYGGTEAGSDEGRCGGFAPRAASRERKAMKVAVISDIHGNRQAFEATLEAVAASDASELWCLGDLVGYGAEPDACVELAREHAAVCLAGNHDLAVMGELPLEEFSRGASLAVQWTQEVIAEENLAFLAGLRPQGHEGAIGLFHASPRDPVWEYVLSALLAELCLDEQQQRVCLIGHSHVALSFVRHEGELATGEPQRGGQAAGPRQR